MTYKWALPLPSTPHPRKGNGWVKLRNLSNGWCNVLNVSNILDSENMNTSTYLYIIKSWWIYSKTTSLTTTNKQTIVVRGTRLTSSSVSITWVWKVKGNIISKAGHICRKQTYDFKMSVPFHKSMVYIQQLIFFQLGLNWINGINRTAFMAGV